MSSAMTNIALLAALLATNPTHALPLQSRNTSPPAESLLRNSGLQNATFSYSVGNNAICVTGNIPVSVTATNLDLDLGELTNQTVVTEAVVEIVQVNTTYPQEAIRGNASISDTFNINAQLCYPVDWTEPQSTVQFLTHGIAFDKAYWDFAEGYSYVDAAAAAGYATFSYDRLGTGASDHPDPIPILQGPLEVEIAHSLIQYLRNGTFAGQAFDQVIGVGHSFGSVITQAITANYPEELDAAVLTGFSTSRASMGLTLVGFNPAIANENQPDRFADLPNPYLVTDTIISNQLTFMRAPNFDPKILEKADAAKQTYTLSEMLTLGGVVKPATEFTGPVDVVNGENDFIFCQSNCNLPTDQSALVLKALYPAASNGSQSTIIPGTGHGINLHYTAEEAYAQILNFVKANGF